MCPPILRSRTGAFAVIATLACAPRGAPPREVNAPTAHAPVGCEVAARGGPAWMEHRVAGTPVAFCAPAEIRYVERSRKLAPPEPRPYPRSSAVPEWMEEWSRAPNGRWALVAAFYVAPNGWPILPADVTDLRQSVVPAAGGSAGPAILREYRLAPDTGLRRPPGGEGFRGFGLSREKAELLVPLRPGTWLVLAANLENPADRALLLRVLQSARRVDQ
jgi:hypothetical protein